MLFAFQLRKPGSFLQPLRMFVTAQLNYLCKAPVTKRIRGHNNEPFFFYFSDFAKTNTFPSAHKLTTEKTGLYNNCPMWSLSPQSSYE